MSKRPFKAPTYPQDPRGPGTPHDWRAAFADRIGAAKARLEGFGKTPRQVLEVAQDADYKTIRKSYRKLCRTYHPDFLPPTATQIEKDTAALKLQALNDAYAVCENASGRNTLSLID